MLIMEAESETHGGMTDGLETQLAEAEQTMHGARMLSSLADAATERLSSGSIQHEERRKMNSKIYRLSQTR